MTDTWQQAVDPALAARLWRRGEQPGLIRHEQAAGILTRHGGMVSGLPLADMLLQREQISNDPGAALDAPLPVVTASLPRAAEPAGPATAEASALPDRADGPAAAERPAASPAAGRATQPIQVTPVSSGADVVVQRMPAAGAAPLAPPHLPLGDGSLADGAPGDGRLTGGPPLMLPAGGAPADGPRIRAVPDLRATADVPRELPWPEQGPGGVSPAALPVVVATPIPDQRPVTAERPLVLVSAPEHLADPGSPPRGETGGRGHVGNGSTREPAPRASDRGASLIVVRERPRRASGPEPGLAAGRRRAPLPLAAIPVPGAPDPARPPWPPHPASAAARPAAASPAPPAAGGQGHVARQRNEPVRPQADPDAGRIAETVRRRFLRELSIEAERRGAGWES